MENSWTAACVMPWRSWMICAGRKGVIWSRSCATGWRASAVMRPAFARRLETRLKELLGGIGIEPARLAQEAALLAERSDISEELDRLKSHLQQFTRLLDGAGELGKKLDFLLQEMHREANTMLSKTPGVENDALAITGVALEIKAEIEKLREQVQNIE